MATKKSKTKSAFFCWNGSIDNLDYDLVLNREDMGDCENYIEIKYTSKILPKGNCVGIIEVKDE